MELENGIETWALHDFLNKSSAPSIPLLMPFRMPPWMVLFLAALVGWFPFLYLLSLIRSKGVKKTPYSTKTHASLPPGPKGLPVLGSLLELGSLPHRSLHKLAQQYGPIMYLRLGLVPTIVVSSPDAAQKFLKTHDLVFASRADTELGRFVTHGQKGVGFTQYGSYWRSMRKFYTVELLSSHRVEFFKYLRREEMGLLLQSLKAAAAARSPTNLTWAVSSLATDITSRMVFGKKFVDVHSDKKSFKEAVTELVALSGAFNIADCIPILGPLDLQGYRRRMKANSRFFETILDKIIDDHLRSSDSSRQRDFVDFMLEFMTSSDNQFQFDRTNIRVLMLETLVSALDTSSATIEWTLSELLKHPRVMKKVQEEMQRVVGMDRAIEESDLANLDYLNMVVKESMRLHPVTPLLIPHESMEDCTIYGFQIPKKSRIIVSAWAIGRDPNAWPNPEEFYPERFIDLNIDVKGQDFQLIPFGSGRRGCPGIHLGLTLVRLVVAQLMHCFDWQLPDGMSATDLDMIETFGIVTPRLNDLWAIPSSRLKRDVEVGK